MTKKQKSQSLVQWLPLLLWDIIQDPRLLHDLLQIRLVLPTGVDHSIDMFWISFQLVTLTTLQNQRLQRPGDPPTGLLLLDVFQHPRTVPVEVHLALVVLVVSVTLIQPWKPSLSNTFNSSPEIFHYKSLETKRAARTIAVGTCRQCSCYCSLPKSRF